MAQYEQGLLVYIDILGFKEDIEQSTANPAKVGSILSVLRVLKSELSESGRPTPKKEKLLHKFCSFSFSDHIVRVVIPSQPDKLLSEFDWEMMLLAEKLWTLFCDHRIALRGGISHGQIYADEETGYLFGPALVRSYSLEEKFAIFPRIVVDSSIIRDAEEHEGKNIGYDWRNYTTQDHDGIYFIDYLHGHFHTALEGPDNAPEILERHQSELEKKIQEVAEKKDERIRQKYLWLALYHNAVIHRLRKEQSEAASEQRLLVETERRREDDFWGTPAVSVDDFPPSLEISPESLKKLLYGNFSADKK